MFDTQVDKLENISLNGSDKSSSGDEDYEEEEDKVLEDGIELD